jgi:D-inositol-3-phosphate glycosyltransferase
MTTVPARIAFLSEHASPTALLGSVDAGGQNVYVDEVSRSLGQLGYLVDVFTRRDDPQLPPVIEWAPGVRIVNLAVGPDHFLPKDDLWSLMPQFREAVLDFMRRDGISYQLIHGNFWMSGWAAVELKRRLKVPVVQIFHAMGKTKQRHQGAADSSPGERIMVEQEVVREVDCLIAQCPSEHAELVEDYGANPNKVAIIPSAVNIERYRPVCRDDARRSIGLPGDDPLVVYVGRMLPRKDPANIVRALALLLRQTDLPVKLLLVGGQTVKPDPVSTPEIAVLQELAGELGIADRVLFTGKRQPQELHLYYSAADVAVTTPWYEPFGLTPLEAMACGRPVIGSDVGGISFTIADGITGYLVPPRDPAALASRLLCLLSDATLRERMGQAARARVERDFTWSTVGLHTAALYQRLLRGEGRVAVDSTGARRSPSAVFSIPAGERSEQWHSSMS